MTSGPPRLSCFPVFILRPRSSSRSLALPHLAFLSLCSCWGKWVDRVETDIQLESYCSLIDSPLYPWPSASLKVLSVCAGAHTHTHTENSRRSAGRELIRWIVPGCVVLDDEQPGEYSSSDHLVDDASRGSVGWCHRCGWLVQIHVSDICYYCLVVVIITVCALLTLYCNHIQKLSLNPVFGVRSKNTVHSFYFYELTNETHVQTSSQIEILCTMLTFWLRVLQGLHLSCYKGQILNMTQK